LYVDHTAVMGGGEIALLQLVRNLDPARFTPTVALLSEGPLAEELTAANVRTILIRAASELVEARRDKPPLSRSAAMPGAIATILRIAKVVEQLGIELVHCNSLKADLLGGAAARLTRRPAIWHIRDRIETDYLPAASVRLLRCTANLLPAHIVANSFATLKTVRLLDESRGSVIYSGLDLEPYLQIPSRPIGSRPRIGIVGRLAPWKGQHIFLQAAALVRRQFPAATFQIIGSPLFSETDYEKSLHNLAHSLGIESAVEFTGFRNDIPKVLDELDVVVHASTTAEPFGQVAVLAMAAGKPLVATAGGGILEIVQDGKTGLLAPLGDAGAMAMDIGALLSRPDWAAELGRAGRRRAAELFTIERTARQIMELYDRLV